MRAARRAAASERRGGDQHRGDQPSAGAGPGLGAPDRLPSSAGAMENASVVSGGDEEPGEEVEVEPAALDPEPDAREHADDHGHERHGGVEEQAQARKRRTGREALARQEARQAAPSRPTRRNSSQQPGEVGLPCCRSAYLSCRQAARCR